MAYEIPVLSITLVASTDLSDYQYRFLAVDANGEAELVDAAATHPVGVLQNEPDEDESGTVMVYGVSKVVAGDAVDAGDLVRSDTVGRAVSAGAGEVVAGIALESADAAGEIIPVLLTPGGLYS